MSKIVRIGGGCAFHGDSGAGPKQLIEAGVDYLMLDYLAEATMPMLGLLRMQQPEAGFGPDFTESVWMDNIEAIKRTGTKVITNAGGVNPAACAQRVRQIAEQKGLAFKIAVIEGDELRNRLDDLANGGETTELYTGSPFPAANLVITANAYIGAEAIARALDMGADVVITGRCVDSALALGPLIHEFGWSMQDYDKLSQGSLAGHVIECGAQGSGGLFTDWEDVPDWDNIGYPIVECHADSSFIVTKPDNTGGLVSEAVVAEQIVYEVGDPQAYLLPDVACDFAHAKVEQIGENRVKLTGAIGRPPTGKYKVSISWSDGFRAFSFTPVVGRRAADKAQRQAEAVLTRLDRMLREKNIGPFRATRIEILGNEASYGANARDLNSREVIAKIGVEHDNPVAIGLFIREWDAPTTSMSVGTTSWFGARPEMRPVARVFSTEIDMSDVPLTITIGEISAPFVANTPGETFNPSVFSRPEIPQAAAFEGEPKHVPLVDLAWARSGDKGDAYNIGVIARHPDYLPYIRAALTREAMLTYFAHDFDDPNKADVKIYDVPGLNGLNLHFLNALGGGQFASLHLDPLGKAKAQQLLDFEVAVPFDLEIETTRS